MFPVVIFGAIIRPDPEGSRENPGAKQVSRQVS
jgi:hypothetical protein